MSTHKSFDKICCVVLAATLIITALFMNAESFGVQKTTMVMGYESKLFDTSTVHTIDIIMDDWDEFTQNCKSEEYYACSVVIDNEAYKNVAIRGKGNTSLTQVESYGNDRYSFKIEFDRYDSTKTYYGLDKLCLNNIIQDNTYMKDYICYQMMGKFGVASPLCSYVYITVNGEDWGLYLAVEGVEEGFLERNYGNGYGELYKPDSQSMGGGRGNGREFNIDDFFDFDSDKFSQSTTDNNDKNITSESSVSKTDSEATIKMLANTQGNMPNDMQGGQVPNGTPGDMQGGQMPNGTPGDMQGGQMPSGTPGDMQGGQMPSGTPGDMQGGQMPDSMTPPEIPSGGQMPENIQPPTDETVPESEQAQPSSEPENTEGEQTTQPSDNTSENNNTQKPDTIPGFDKGGMTSSNDDVLLKYIDDEVDSYSNIFDNAKTNVSTSDKKRLISALKNLSDGTDLESTVDIDKVIRYFVVHNFVLNFDSYTGSMIHNYYLYEKDGQMQMIPWDYNLAFGGFQSAGGATNLVNYPIDSPVSGGNTEDRPMIAWIFANEEYTELYHKYFSEFISDYFDSGYFEEMIDSVKEMISPYVEKDPTKFCTYDEFEKGVSTLKEFCLLRAESISGQLDGTIGSTSSTQKSDTLIDASNISISDMGSMNNSFGGKMDIGTQKGENSNGVNVPQIPQNFDSESTVPQLPNGDSNFDKDADSSSANGDEADGQKPSRNDFADKMNRPDSSSFGSSAVILIISIAVLAAGIGFALIFKRRK